MASKENRQWDAVFAEELDRVSSRHADGTPARENLVGLAFSGGGIRSATFGLGVLECLKRLGLLKRIDYLSTVSGGGYIGAWLSANCKRTADRKATGLPAVDWLDKDADWKESIGHLRRYSNYLSPEVGFFSADTWSIGAIWLRNTLLVQLTVILAIAVALLLPRPLFQLFLGWPDVGVWRWTSVALFILAVAGIAGNEMRLNTVDAVDWLSYKTWKRGLALSVGCLLAAWAIGVTWEFAPFTNGPVDYRVAFPVSLLLVLAGFFAQPVVVRVLKALPFTGAPEQINYTQGWAQAVVVLPMMATGYLVAAILWGLSTDTSHQLAGLDSFGDFFREGFFYWPLPLSVAFASLWVLSYCSRERNDQKKAAIFWALVAPVPTIVVLHALISAIMLLLHGWAQHQTDGNWLAFVWAPSLVLYAFTLSVIVLIGMMGRQLSESVREWWSRLGAWLGIYGFAWMLIAVAAVYGPKWAAILLDGNSWAGVSSVWLATTVAGLLSGKSDATSGGSRGGAIDKTRLQKAVGVVTAIAPFVFIAGLLIGVSMGLHLIILSSSVPTLPSVANLHLDHWANLNDANGGVVLTVLVVALLALALLADRVDINEFSLNAFYRSRLSRCYLGATRLPGERSPQNFTGFDEQDDVRMAELGGSDTRPTAGPLHIINCALNLGGSSDLALHTRHSASFTVTPYATGSSYESKEPSGVRTPMGYRSTRFYGGENGQPTLGQAMSVSGAAASPNMGYHSSPVMAFLMTVFNVRLGWWFPNPRMSGTESPSPWFSLRYLFAELFGGANDKAKFLMISDGGHFENLAAYELIRRQCRVVIMSDAEADPELRFSGLGTLIRMCEVDFDARIVLDVTAIRSDFQTNWSTRRYAVGRIVYGGGVPDGVLIYLKASMIGREDSAVLQYKADHPAFPHEPTSDQFYGEDQFESYRRLGQEVAGEALEALQPVAGGRTLVTLAGELLESRATEARQEVRRPV